VLFGVVYAIINGIITALFLTSYGYGGFGYGWVSLAASLPWILAGLVYAGYDFAMHRYRNGQTLGKLVMKTRLVSPDGGAPDQATLLKRAAIYPGIIALSGLFSFVPFLGFLVGLLASVGTLVDGISVFTDEPLRRALHDKWTGTLVVKAG
jgi:uncharacterized RDD family membrane protein YckC